MRRRRCGVVVGYLAAFYARDCGTILANRFATMPADSLSRLFWPLLLPPDDLLPIWFGTPPHFALADRLPVLLVAAAVVLGPGPPAGSPGDRPRAASCA